MNENILFRKARISDVTPLLKLIGEASQEGHVLARSLNYLYDNVRDFWVAEREGKPVGCGSLHICWENLAEIKSVVVEEAQRRHGIGAGLVKQCIQEAKDLGIATLFVLTYSPGFFQTLGFGLVDKSTLPHKVWLDCIHCPKFPDCEEVALTLNVSQEERAD